MSEETSTRLSLSYVMPAQAQKHVTVNESLRRLDALACAAASSRAVTGEPAAPAEGEGYLLPAGASGESWDGLDEGDLVVFQDGAWARIAPFAGLRVLVLDEPALIVFDGTQWIDAGEALARLSNLEQLGVGTEADAANPLSAKLNACLFTALTASEGGSGDLRYTMNKEAAGDVLSVLMQSGFSGRAEIGLVGDDDLQVKVSPDGASWTEAMRIANADGRVIFPAGVELTSVNGGAFAGERNTIINGDFSVWQRGTSFIGDMQGRFIADRWLTSGSPAIPVNTMSAERVDVTPGEAASEAAVRLTRLDAACLDIQLRQKVESVYTLAGRPATFSFRARASASMTMLILLQQWFGSGGSPARSVASSTVSVGTVWETYSVTLDFPDLTGMTIGAGSHIVALLRGLPAVNGWLEVTDVQMEEGTRFTGLAKRLPGTELAHCRRFFRRYATQQDVADLAYAMRVQPSQSGTGPYDYDAEL